MHRIDDDEPVSSGSKMSGEYSLDDRKITDDKGSNKASKKSPSKEPPSKSSGKTVACKVYLLDGESVEINIDKNDYGKALFDKVCAHLKLTERDYFGLTYSDDRGPGHSKVWLNMEKKVSKQIKRGAWVFEFALKFYPPDPSQLREYLTRWLVVLQIRRDLLSGKIPCTFSTYAVLGSYSVQADIHDHEPATHGNSFDYIRDMVFAPNQTPELLEKIAELHRLHRGQQPHEADLNFLDNAKKLAMYGIDLHKAKDSDNIAVMVGVCCSGLLIFRDKLRLNRFVWPKILKLSYKRNHFYIKIRPGEMERNETTIMFKLDNHKLAKRLWKTCVEHHAFFRLREAEKPENSFTFPRFGSKFRYSGGTLYENKNAPLINRAPHNFDRSSPSKNTMRNTGNKTRSMENVVEGPFDDDTYDPDETGSGMGWKYHKGVSSVKTGDTDTLSWKSGDDGHFKKLPHDTEFAGSKNKLSSQGDATLEREKGLGHSDSVSLTAGGIEDYEDAESVRERRRREKENDRKRKEEAEEKKKREKNKNLSSSEDKIDQLGHGEATQTAFGVNVGSAAIQDGRDEKFNPYGPPYGRDGYNKNGYDKDCYDRDGFDKDGYDRNDIDIKGRKKPYAPPYARDGYNNNGYGRDGFDREGFDKNAFDTKGLNKRWKKSPYGPPYEEDGFNENGFNKHGLDPDGRDKDGYDKNDTDIYGRKNPYAPPYGKDGYNENGFDKHGFDRDGYDKDGFDKDGYDRLGHKTPYGPPYGRDGYNKNGYDMDGYDRDGFDKDGYDRNDIDIKGRKKPYAPPYARDGYNNNGYGIDGFDREGFDKNAFDRKGYNKRGRKNPYGPPYDKDGFNENGFNKHGLDPDGRDKDGYDKNDTDIYGRKNPYAPPYGKDGYNENGFNKHGFDKDGYDKDGFDKDGYDRLGHKTPYGPPYGRDGYNKNGYDMDGYDRDGFDKDGYDRNDIDIKGRKKPYAPPYAKDGYNNNGYGRDGFDREGFDKNAFDTKGLNKRGKRSPYGPPYDEDGFNENGFNKHGLDPEGYDKDGYDKTDTDRYGRKNPYAPPYGKDGYNENGFDKHGFDRDGYDKNGFNKDGFDRNGRKTPYGPPYGRDGYNKNGYDMDGFNRDGFDMNGYSRDGRDKLGKSMRDRLFDQTLAAGKGDSSKGTMGLAIGKVDTTGVVGEEKSVDNRVQFIPVSKPVRETKDKIKPKYTDSQLPSFNPLSTSTAIRNKVPPPVPPKGSRSSDDSLRPSTVAMEPAKSSSRNTPLVKTETHSVTYERGNSPYDLDDGILVSAHSHSSKLQTVETTTYKTEKNGVVETRVEQKFTVSMDGEEDFDYDSALRDAIRSVIEFNPDMSVERIECVQHIEDDGRSGK